MTVTHKVLYYDSQHFVLMLQVNVPNPAVLPHNLNAVKINQPVMLQHHILRNRVKLNLLTNKLFSTKF